MPPIADDVLYLSVRELGEQIRSHKLSPVDLTEAYLERASRIGARLNAFATLTPDLARAQAKAAEAEIKSGKYRGPLHGIPYAAKDLLAVPGYPTKWGAKPYADQKFDYEATVIRKLREAGAILLGKAAMIELAGGMGYRFASASVTGPAKNPWNEGCWTCGSSSGSGAIVAAGLAAFAIGTETWGSIICPSSYCGVSGLRPTYGRVSRHGAMALSYSMDKIGPMARSAEDCGLILSAISGFDAQDPGSLQAEVFAFSPKATSAKPANGQPLRIGWVKDPWGKDKKAETDAAAKDAIDLLAGKGGAHVSEAVLPDGPWEAAGGIVISVEGAAAFGNLLDSGKVADLADPVGHVGGYVGQHIHATDYLRAQRVRGILQKKMETVFADFDVIAAAGEATTATPLDIKLDDPSFSFSDPLGGIGNLCGLPAISVPCGFHDGKPVSIQFIGAPRAEATVLAAAMRFQSLTDWHRRRPPVT